MPSPPKHLNYRRKGVGVNNVAAAQYQKLVLRTLITSMGGDYRWRVMAEDTQKATGTCSSRRGAVEAANAVLKSIKAKSL